MLNSVLAANEAQIDRALRRIESTGHNRIGILGISFKAGTDDLRESPMVRIVDTLHERGYDIRIYDPYVSIAAIQGANKEYISLSIPHIRAMLTTDFQTFLEHADTITIGNQSLLFRWLLRQYGRNRNIIDLVHLLRRRTRKAAPIVTLPVAEILFPVFWLKSSRVVVCLLFSALKELFPESTRVPLPVLLIVWLPPVSLMSALMFKVALPMT